MPRAPTPSLLLDVWREVCRHIEINESLARIAPILAQTLPVTHVLVRRIESKPARLVTVASGGARLDDVPARRELTAEEFSRIDLWLKAVRVQAWSATGGDALRFLLCPGELEGAIVAGPLTGSGASGGVLIVCGGEELVERRNVVQLLLEPIAVALENDHRLHEMARLREAAEAENRALLARLQRQDISDSIVGAESGLKDVMARSDQVSRTDAPVLILGETGTGKEVVARTIHSRSRRASGPFLRVNCGAIPTELVDSELFGHERGAFTGALNQRKGWFERADGGTLFLDEVGELPAAAQVRLLRVLQDGTFERVGAQQTLNVDVRIVAATHRDMQQLIADGRFRPDLWYRISVFPILLPALRDRVEDIRALARHFADRAGLRLHGLTLVPTESDLVLLERYPWPGNVRELASVIERAAILGDGRHLEVAAALGSTPPADLRNAAGDPLRPRNGAPARSPGEAEAAGSASAAGAPRPPGAAAPHSATSDALPLDTVMVKTIEEALTATAGRIEGPTGAAARLGINPHTLRSRMRKFGIDWSHFRTRTNR